LGGPARSILTATGGAIESAIRAGRAKGPPLGACRRPRDLRGQFAAASDSMGAGFKRFRKKLGLFGDAAVLVENNM
jgi:hypothetical protein